METKINVLIVDDQARARQSLRAMLSTLPQVAAIREASNGLEALHSIEEAQPDLVLMDVRMPVMDGLEATRQIKVRWPQVRVIILSMYTDLAAEAVASGADEFVGKGEPPERLFEAIDSGLSETGGVQ